MKNTITLRVRTPQRMLRVDNITSRMSFIDVKVKIAEQFQVDVSGHEIYADNAYTIELPDELLIGSSNLHHGDVIYMNLESNSIPPAKTTSRIISQSGDIITQQFEDRSSKSGFRPGMMPLRSMKLHWTVNEFMELESQFTFKIKRQEETFCKGVSLDSESCNSIQSYMRCIDFRQCRFALLYGRYSTTVNDSSGSVNKAIVDYIHEPNQDCSVHSTHITNNNSDETAVLDVTSYLGMKPVGVLFAHPARETGFYLSSHEVLSACQYQLEAGDGISPNCAFVTVSLSVNENNEAVFEAYQMSMQALSLVAESALAPSNSSLSSLAVAETFTTLVAGKAESEIDTAFLVIPVPILHHSNQDYIHTFPVTSRIDCDRPSVGKQIQRAGTKGWKLIQLCADVEFLLYLYGLLDKESVKRICASIVDKNVPFEEEGFSLLLGSL